MWNFVKFFVNVLQHICRVCYMLSPIRLSVTRVAQSKTVEAKLG